MRMKAPMLLAIALIFISALSMASSQAARKENVKFLRCPVCEEVAKQLYSQISEKKLQLGKKKMSEVEIIEVVEKLCDIKKKESEWMFFLDIVQEGRKLKLVEQPEEGECNTKCKTIERTCKDVIGEHDTDIGEYIFTHLDELSVDAISKTLCKDLTKSCVRPPVPPKKLELGEPFTPKPSKDADISRLMRSMGEIPGAPGMQMYSKEDLLNMKKFGGGGDGDDEEDDEDDDEIFFFQSLLKKSKAPVAPQKKSVLEIISSVSKELVDNVRDNVRDKIHSGKRAFNRAVKTFRRWRRKRSKQQKNLKNEL